jgi:hypothetical protein
LIFQTPSQIMGASSMWLAAWKSRDSHGALFFNVTVIALTVGLVGDAFRTSLRA